MPASKAQQKAVNKYMAANYDRINLTVAKGQRDTIRTHAEAQGESANGFINRAIIEAIERDTGAAGGEFESIDEINGNLTTVQPVPSGTLAAARSAAIAAGEKPVDFIVRALSEQAERDAAARKEGAANE